MQDEKIRKPIIAADQVKRDKDALSQARELMEEVEEVEKVSPDTAAEFDALYYEVCNHFGLKANEVNATVKQKLSDIVEWAKEVGGGDTTSNGDILLNISKLEKELRSPGITERRWANVHRFCVLEMDRIEIGKKQAAITA